MIYSISKRFLNQVMSRQQVCIAILCNLDGVAQPVSDLLNTNESSRCEQRRKSCSHCLDGQPLHSVGSDVVLEGPSHVIAITVSATLKLLRVEKIAGTRREGREVALKEFSSILRHRNHTLFPILNSEVAERRVRPRMVAHPQEPVLEIDPSWQRMINLPPPKAEVKTQNQKELEVIVLGGRDEPVALLVSREPAIRSRFRLFGHDIDSGIVRNFPRAVRPPKQARNAGEVGRGRMIRNTGSLLVVPFLKVSGGNCGERFCDTCHTPRKCADDPASSLPPTRAFEASLQRTRSERPGATQASRRMGSPQPCWPHESPPEDRQQVCLGHWRGGQNASCRGSSSRNNTSCLACTRSPPRLVAKHIAFRDL